jgi:proton-coupled amino acid transporter
MDNRKVIKIGPVATFFVLLKGFIGTGILFLPKGFRNGGWAFSIGAILFSLVLSLACILMLIKTRSTVRGGASFSELGQKSMGKFGKIVVDICLAAS